RRANQQEDRQLVLPVARNFKEVARRGFPGKHATRNAGGHCAQRRRRSVDLAEQSRCRGERTTARRRVAQATAFAIFRKRSHSALRLAKSGHAAASAILRQRPIVAWSRSATLALVFIDTATTASSS